MKKFLLTAVIALIGMSAWAAKPESGTKGYFYNPAAGMFIDTNAKLSATEGELFEVKYKSDTEKAADPAADYPGRGFDGGYYIRFKSSKGDLGMESNPLKNGSGYAQFIVIEKDGKWLISHPYPNTGGNVPGWVNDNLEAYQAAYLQVVDGALVFAQGTENEGAYWQFIDEDTYKKIAGPTYPIALAGTVAGVTVEYTGTSSAEAPYSAKFTAASELLNIIKYESFDVSEFIGYGYKKIVVEFAEAAGSAWRFHSYGGRFDNIEELGGKTKHELKLSGNSIDDLTIFNWTSSTNQTLEITAMYFSKYEVGEDPEPEPEPEPVLFPETGAKGYIYNPATNMFINTSGTLVAKDAITETDMFEVYRFNTADKTDNVETEIRFGVAGSAASKHLRINENNNVLQAQDTYYSKWNYVVSENKFLLKACYDRGTDPQWCTKGYYLTATEDGAYEYVAEPTTASYWQFLTQDDFDNLATSISSVAKTVAPVKGIYNVAGQQLNNLQKGLNIVNGKKVYVK